MVYGVPKFPDMKSRNGDIVCCGALCDTWYGMVVSFPSIFFFLSFSLSLVRYVILGMVYGCFLSQFLFSFILSYFPFSLSCFVFLFQLT